MDLPSTPYQQQPGTPHSQQQHQQPYPELSRSHSQAQSQTQSFNHPYGEGTNSYPDHFAPPTPGSSFHQHDTVASTTAHAANGANGSHAANIGNSSTHQFNDPIASPQDQDHSPPSGRFTEEWEANQRGTSLLDGGQGSSMQRSSSVHSYTTGDDQHLPSRGNTLKKKNSMRRNGSLNRSSSRRSMRAGSVKSLQLQSSSDPDEAHNAFHCPVPTSGNPTDVLANRFQSWRKILKDLIAYFREIQSHYEHRSKSLVKLVNVSNSIQAPPGIMKSAGIDDALQFLRVYNKNAVVEANKAKDIEEDVILALTGLRSDLQQKIKEIKNLSGDFKNTVDKEMDHTRKAVKTLSEVLGKTEMDESLTTGKSDPYLLRLAVDRQIERQLDEENYLHQAYLNLENSGRELESIVVGEIQKAYNAYTGILKREADNSYNVIGELREGPIAMPKDQEWIHFVTHDDRFIDPNIPLRSADQIHYPGQDHLSAQEIRAGLLERKSKYLKSYTAGWYVLSSTHLHEFKSADKAQAPVMSLYLPEQKLGSHSSEGGSSNKFILKGRQTGSMHRGHTWVFRAESHDTMMAWYADIKALTEKTPEERSKFVRSHSRSLSRSSHRSVSSDGLDDDDDEEPFAAESQVYTDQGSRQHDVTPRRSQAGGRFPSDIQVNAQRGLQAPRSPSSVSSGNQEQKPEVEAQGSSTALPGAAVVTGTHEHIGSSENYLGYGATQETPLDEMPSSAAIANQKAHYDGVNPYTSEPVQQTEHVNNYYNEGNTFVPVVVPQTLQDQIEKKPKSSAPQSQEQQAYFNDFDQESRNVQRYDENGAIPKPITDGFAEGNELNGGISGSSYNMMAVNAEGFPNLDPVGNLKSESTPTGSRAVPEMAPIPTTGDVKIGDKAPVRPTSQNNRTESVQTISNLHIPGQYPKGAAAGPSA